LALADRIGVLDEGRLIWCGTPQAIADADHPRVRALVESLVPASQVRLKPDTTGGPAKADTTGGPAEADTLGSPAKAGRYGSA